MIHRYEPKETWSGVYGMWGYRIFDNERQVFVSPWQPLLFKAEELAERLEAGIGRALSSYRALGMNNGA